MYHQAMSTSIDLGMEFGIYDSKDSAEGILQPDLWENSDVDGIVRTHIRRLENLRLPPRLGVETHYHLMPTASYSHISWERSEAAWSCTRRPVHSEDASWRIIVVNKKLVKMLEERDSGHGITKPLSSTRDPSRA
jgi:hypothetical protein